jgi:hypothetical protein
MHPGWSAGIRHPSRMPCFHRQGGETRAQTGRSTGQQRVETPILAFPCGSSAIVRARSSGWACSVTRRLFCVCVLCCSPPPDPPIARPRDCTVDVARSKLGLAKKINPNLRDERRLSIEHPSAAIVDTRRQP